MLESLIEAGMSVARFNFSHGDHEGHKACLDRLREASKNKNRHVGKQIMEFTPFLEAIVVATVVATVAVVLLFLPSNSPKPTLSPIRHSCLVGYQGTRDSNWILCRR